MNITEAAIKNNRVTLLVLVVLLLGGLSAYSNLPRAEDPGFIIRTAVVRTYFPGASPERVELLVTDKLEESVQEMAEIDFISSVSRNGLSLVFVNIQARYKQMRPIWDDLRRKVDEVSEELPSGVVGPFVDDDFGDVYPIMLTITGDGFNYAEMKDVADDVRDELLRLDSVAKVDVFGAQEERIFVEYNNARLAEVGLSPMLLQAILEARNIIISGGTLTVGGEDISLEPTGNFDSIEDLRRTLIQIPDRDDVVYLEDLALIYRGYIDPPTSIMHSSGTRCLGLSMAPPDGGNVTVMGEEVQDLVAQLPYVYPVGIDFDLVLFQPEFVDRKVGDFVMNLLQAVGIVLLVMLASLGLRTGLVVSTLIPSTMLITLLIMSMLGIGLDQISIAALIIALGMLVDNAIVMSESIMVQIQEGKSPLRAAVDSAGELRVPLLTSSLTTAAAFLPIFLAKSSVGEYTASLFKVVTIALLTSWALSLTVMPLLCMHAIRVKARDKAQSYGSRFYTTYRVLLTFGLERPWLVIAATVASFALAMYGLTLVPNVFIPKSDSSRMVVELDLPLGTAIAETEAVVDLIETHILDSYTAAPDAEGGESSEGFLSWSTYVGSVGGPRYRLAYNPAQEGSEHASLIFTATSRAFIDGAIPQLERFCRDNFPSLSYRFEAEAMGPAAAAPVEVRIIGKGHVALFEIVDSIKNHLYETPGTFNVEDDWGPETKKLLVKIDQARARRSGVTSQDVAISLQTGLSGLATTEYREGDKIIPVTLRSVAGYRHDIGKLESLNVFVQSTGRSVPLMQIADVEVVWEPSKILRRDRYRTVTVQTHLEPGANALALTASLAPWLAEQSASWPPGFRYELGGDFEESQEGNASIAEQLPIAGLIVLVLLVTQFNSLRRTTIVLLTIPLGLIGVTFGLLSTRTDFTFFAMLGVVSLAGIIINNAIVLLDRIKLEIEVNGREPAEAVIESAQRRLRPILLTTATTVGGLLPLWLFGGPMWKPMAVSIIFGLLFATMLTLGLVPVLYRLFFRVKLA